VGQEVELKLACNGDIEWSALVDLLGRVGADCSEQPKVDLCNTYYDTEDLALHKAKAALRVRLSHDTWIQTFKTQGQSVDGLSRRGEWEWLLDSKELNTRVLSECPEWPGQFPIYKLAPVFDTNFERRLLLIAYKGLSIELAFDKGFIVAGGQKETINEIELELKHEKGSEARTDRSLDKANAEEVQILLKLSVYLQKHLPLTPDDRSKAERAYALYAQSPKSDSSGAS
jgi:inorganic triphosphatase YgiF